MEDEKRKATRLHEIESMAPILGRLIQHMGQNVLKNHDITAELQAQWPVLVGEEVNAHARPVRMSEDTLHILVDSSVWLHQLSTFAKPSLLKTLQNRWPWIKDLKFRSSPKPFSTFREIRE